MSDVIFSLNESLLSGIVCHLPSSILEVLSSFKRTINNTRVNLFTQHWCSVWFCNLHCELVHLRGLCIFCGYFNLLYCSHDVSVAYRPLSLYKCYLNTQQQHDVHTRYANLIVEMWDWTIAHRPHRKCDANANAFASNKIASSTAAWSLTLSPPAVWSPFITPLDADSTSK